MRALDPRARRARLLSRAVDFLVRGAVKSSVVVRRVRVRRIRRRERERRRRLDAAGLGLVVLRLSLLPRRLSRQRALDVLHRVSDRRGERLQVGSQTRRRRLLRVYALGERLARARQRLRGLDLLALALLQDERREAQLLERVRAVLVRALRRRGVPLAMPREPDARALDVRVRVLVGDQVVLLLDVPPFRLQRDALPVAALDVRVGGRRPADEVAQRRELLLHERGLVLEVRVMRRLVVEEIAPTTTRRRDVAAVPEWGGDRREPVRVVRVVHAHRVRERCPRERRPSRQAVRVRRYVRRLRCYVTNGQTTLEKCFFRVVRNAYVSLPRLHTESAFTWHSRL
eukprot:30894-Pelagococcus_subviridis.AAC.5